MVAGLQPKWRDISLNCNGKKKTTNPAVTIHEGMDCFKLIVDEERVHQGVDFWRSSVEIPLKVA